MTNRFALLLVATALVACGRERRLEKKQKEVEKVIEETPLGANTLPESHEYPEGRSGDVRALFESGVLSYTVATVHGDHEIETHVVTPQPVFVGDRHVIVSAPPKVHSAINKVLDGLGKQKAKSTSFDLSVWLVEAKDAAKTSISPELGDVLFLLENLPGYGPRRYTMIDHVSARTVEGTQSSIVGRLVKIENKLNAQGDVVQLEVAFDLLQAMDPATGIQGSAQVPLGRAVVLGSSTVATPNGGIPTLLFYIVRVRRLDSPNS
jgi:hypothetical protein